MRVTFCCLFLSFAPLLFQACVSLMFQLAAGELDQQNIETFIEL